MSKKPNCCFLLLKLSLRYLKNRFLLMAFFPVCLFVLYFLSGGSRFGSEGKVETRDNNGMAELEPSRCFEKEQGRADASLTYTEFKRWPSALSKTEK